MEDSYSLVFSFIISAVFLLRSNSKAKKRILIALYAFTGVYLLYVVYVGGDFKPTHRFFVLPAAFMAVFTGAGISLWLHRARGFWQRIPAIFILLFIIAQAVISGGNVRQFAQWRSEVLPIHISAGQWLGGHFSDTTLIATGNAGVIPFYSELACIDMHGLCDRVIASRPIASMGSGLPGHEKGDGLYVLSRHPDIILFMQSRFSDYPATDDEVSRKLFGISETEIWSTSVFHEGYRLESIDLGITIFNYYKKL